MLCKNIRIFRIGFITFVNLHKDPAMKLVYTLVIEAYSIILRIVAPINSRAREWVNGRRDLLRIIEEKVAPGEKRIWFHCASLGEFEQGRPVIESYRKAHPDVKIVLTFFSPSGYNVRKNYHGADYVFYLPADTLLNVKRFLDAVDPVAAVFIKYEFWYHYLELLHRRNIHTILISAIFRPEQHFFKWYGGFFREMLRFLDHIFVQDKLSEELLNSIGLTNITVSGDTRFDRVAEVVSKAEAVGAIEDFAGDAPVLVAGSSWPPDEEIIARYARERRGMMKFIIAPHEVDSKNIERIMKLFGAKAVRLSDYNSRGSGSFTILVIDRIGILSSVYRYAYICLIGGGFGKGIHNTLEAATWGKPVLFGPNYTRFREAVDLILLKGPATFNGYEQFAGFVDNWLTDRSSYDYSSEACKRYVSDNEGATSVIIEHLVKHQTFRPAVPLS